MHAPALSVAPSSVRALTALERMILETVVEAVRNSAPGVAGAVVAVVVPHAWAEHAGGGPLAAALASYRWQLYAGYVAEPVPCRAIVLAPDAPRGRP